MHSRPLSTASAFILAFAGALAGLAAPEMASALETRTIRLGDLGHGGGIVLRDPLSTAEVLFPLPDRATEYSASLTLDISSSGLLTADAALTLEVEGVPLRGIAMDDAAPRRIDVPLPPRLLQQAMLRVRLVGSLATERGRCGQRGGNPARWISIGPESGLALTGRDLPGSSIGAVWRSLAGTVSLGMAEQPDEAALTTALRLMTALHRRGSRVRLTTLSAVLPAAELPDLLVAPGPELLARHGATPGALATFRPAGSGADAGRPRLVVASPAAASLLIDLPATVAAQRSVHDLEERPEPPPAAGDRLSFAAAGMGPESLNIVGNATLRLPVPLSAIPEGQRPSEVVLFGQGSALAADQALLASVAVDGILLESVPMRGQPRFDGLRVRLPPALVRNGMALEIGFRHLGGQPCDGDGPVTFQIRDTSYLGLEAQAEQPVRLDDWLVRRGQRVEAVLAADMASILAGLPLVASRLSAAGAGSGIDVRLGAGHLGEAPFVYFGRATPAGIDEPRVRLDQGLVSIVGPGGAGRLSFVPGRNMTVLQLVRAQGRAGLWISPGPAASLVPPPALGTAQVALIDAGGTAAAITTGSMESAVEYPENPGIAELVRQYRNLLFLVAWAALTAIMAAWVIRLRRSRR